MGKHVNKPPMGPDDNKIGYRKPPKKNQFPKGKSGNPKGRPPGSKGVRTDLRKVLAAMQTVKRNGEDVTGTTQFLMLNAMALRASLGDVKAFAALIPLVLQAFGLEDRDVDETRLSPGDQALLMRFFVHQTIETDPEPKPRRSRKKSASGKPASSGGQSGAPSPKPRKPRSSGNSAGE